MTNEKINKYQEEIDLDHIDCYVNVSETVNVLCGKWKLLILFHITIKPRRFNELRRLIPEISQKMLTNQLKELKNDSLILRTVYPASPPMVEYSITEYGKTLEPIFDVLYDWGKAHKALNQEFDLVDNNK